MATLFLIERPKHNSPAIRDAAIDTILPEVLSWLQKDGIAEDRPEEVRVDLANALHGLSDGYEAARSLDRDGWSPDARLVEILDGFSYVEHAAHRKAVKAWVVESGEFLKPQFEVGQQVSFKRNFGRETVTGKIVSIDMESATYTVEKPGDGITKNGCTTIGSVINWEDAEAA